MRLICLKLKNYRRFRELKLEFPDGVVGILGPNGVGKSTIIEGVAWALFGNVEEVVRTAKEGVRWAGARPGDTCSAVLEFELAGTEYRVEREMGGRSLSVKASLRTKDTVLADSDRSVREKIQKLIGMDYKSFFTSVFARQKELNALLSVAPGERKKTVLRMLRIDGVDDVLSYVREDKNAVENRIRGAQATLLMEDGREKEAVLSERLPELSRSLETAENELKEAERREKDAEKEASAAKEKRDSLRKDVEAYNTASGDLKAIESTISTLRAREKSTMENLAKARAAAERLPTLEEEEKAWREASARKDELESEREKSQKAEATLKEIATDEAEVKRREDELSGLRSSLPSAEDLKAKIVKIDEERAKCDSEKESMSKRIGELDATIDERAKAAEKDGKKLEEIMAAGKDGTCPTCERRLDEAYDLLVAKLTGSSELAARAASDARLEVARLRSDLEGLARKGEALRKKRVNLEAELNRLTQHEASIAERTAEIEKVRERISKRKKDFASLGQIAFSHEEYSVLLKEHSRLKERHDEFIRTSKEKELADSFTKELESVGGQIAKAAKQEQQYKNIVAELEPKKNLHYATSLDFDQKTVIIGKMKDALRGASARRDKAFADSERVRGELDEIERVKHVIHIDRKQYEDLALLDGVVVDFRDHLIGRVAPALSALTSKELEAMTDGRYDTVRLDENYEMLIDDQGETYPVRRFSGGETDLANLGLRLAISGVIADRTGAPPINLLILDEIFGSLDPDRKRSVMTAMSRLSGQFSQIFLITHIEDVKDMMGHVIKVEEQEDGTSRAWLVT